MSALTQDTSGLARPRSGFPGKRNQVTMDVGVYAAAISYARRLGISPMSIGAGLWGAWEPEHTFDRNVFEPIGALVFARYAPTPWLHGDLGITGARYLWTDDCSDCTGTFFGARAAVLAGWRYIFAGPDVSVGLANDERSGSQFGAIWGAQLRLAFGGGS